MSWPPPRRAVIVLAILLAALALRLAEVQGTSYRPINDASVYLRLASEIAHRGGYSTHDRGAGGTKGPSAYFPPAYPYFLAVVDILDGHRTPRGASVNPARISQAVLGTATVALVGLVALEVFGETVALIALALAAVYPVLIELSGTLVAENLLTPLVLAAMWATLRARRSPRPYRWIAVAGALTGLATLSHENGVLLVAVLAIAVWTGRPRFGLRALAAPALLVVAAALTVAPWTIRNLVVLHAFVPVSTETGVTLAGTYNPASAAYKPVPYKWRIYYGIPQDRALVRQSSHLTEPQLDHRLRTQALRYIEHHPLSLLAVAYHNTRRLFELEGSFAWHASAKAQSIPAGTARVGVISFWVVCALAITGAFTRLARRAPRWLWVVPVLLGLSVVLINVETPRFREPLEPFLIMLAACALAAAAARLRRVPVGGDAGTPVAVRPAELVKMVKRLA